jgi:sulfur-carrier protein
MTTTVRVALPASLRHLAKISADGDIELAVSGPVSVGAILDVLERNHPSLRGTLRDQASHRRRPFIRFFACQQDVSHQSAEEPLPPAVAEGHEPFIIIGAIAGG